MSIRKGRLTSQGLITAPVNFPIGTVHAYAGTNAPEGWAMCDGSAVSRTEYAALFAVIGTTYGVGDGSTTFNLPDMRGEFLRGLDNMGTAAGARGKDVDGTARTVGQTQSQATAKNGLSASQDQHRHSEGTGGNATNLNYNKMAGASGTTYQTVYTDYAQPAITVSSTDTETRPENMAVNYIIKL